MYLYLCKSVFMTLLILILLVAVINPSLVGKWIAAVKYWKSY